MTVAVSARTQRPSRGDVVDGRYTLVEVVGSGRSSEVWRARDLRLGRDVALKRVGDLTAGWREARAAASVGARSVVRVYDVIGTGRTGWVVMELLVGSTLRDVLARRGRLDPGEAIGVAEDLLRALDAVHRVGLVHRDVKPANVHLGRDGRLVLLDFDLAVAPCTTGGASVAPTAGSVPFLAPEIVESGSYSSASDLYALGITILQTLTGAPAARLAEGRPDRTHLVRLLGPAAAADPLVAIVAGLLDHDPSRRQAAAAALRLWGPPTIEEMT